MRPHPALLLLGLTACGADRDLGQPNPPLAQWPTTNLLDHSMDAAAGRREGRAEPPATPPSIPETAPTPEAGPSPRLVTLTLGETPTSVSLLCPSDDAPTLVEWSETPVTLQALPGCTVTAELDDATVRWTVGPGDGPATCAADADTPDCVRAP